MKYALIENNKIIEYPIFEGDIRARFPNISFASDFIPPENYVCVFDAPFPSIDYTKNVKEGTPKFVDNRWTMNWEVSDASDEEVSDRITGQWNIIRIERNAKLMRSDWTRLDDAPVDQDAWAVYRQALRDITKQPDPFNVIWPTPPQ